MNIAVSDHNPVNQVEATSVARQVGPKSGEMPLGKAGFAMKSSRDLWFWLLVLGFLVFPCSVVSAAEDTQIESSFLAFQKSWIQKLNKEGRYGEKSMRVDRSPEDRSMFIARYDVVKEAGARRIKKTGQTACPYVGVMSYEVWSCTAKGKTQDEAKRGPFQCQPQSEITEIFRYAGGMWVY